ncbi:MAG: UDP-N-acetylglucosamine 2-epimerase (non-hydrolyzing) [Oribacterium sp.]|nr:UDP-N-acetylglucosamine 2-epimerase (non-hydrolyzing) [Oribacterium sp.]
MKKVMLVFGTRPEAIKMCPLVLELKKHREIETVVCVTAQHREMLDSVLEIFGVVPDYDMNIMKEKQSLFDITGAILGCMDEILEKEKPDVVLVHGDTTTSFATALSAFYKRIKVGHVEAGLRTYDIYSPYPEEFNRQAVDIISDYCFAPTETSSNNLHGSHSSANRKVYVTGNTVIDALKYTVKDDYSSDVTKWADGSRLILITAHRRESLGKPMENMFRAILRVVKENLDVKAVYPVHPNPLVREMADSILQGSERIMLIPPVNVVDFHNLMNKSYLILTDSGGIQEEAPGLGKPVLVMRDVTERPEGIAAGTLKLVGTSEETIYSEFTRLLNDQNEYGRMSKASNPYGDGHASERIVSILLSE